MLWIELGVYLVRWVNIGRWPVAILGVVIYENDYVALFYGELTWRKSTCRHMHFVPLSLRKSFRLGISRLVRGVAICTLL